MREADILEVWAAARMTPIEALEASYNASMESWTLAAESGPVAMGGVVSPNCVWLLGTNWITENGLTFTRLVQPKIAALLKAYGSLFNYVHHDNEVAKKWLAAMGFTLEPAKPHGVHSSLFNYFWKKE